MKFFMFKALFIILIIIQQSLADPECPNHSHPHCVKGKLFLLVLQNSESLVSSTCLEKIDIVPDKANFELGKTFFPWQKVPLLLPRVIY